MKPILALLLTGWICLLVSCSPTTPTLTLIADGEIHILRSGQVTTAKILAEAGIALHPGDRLLYLGETLSTEAGLPAEAATLTLRRAVPVRIYEADLPILEIKTSALTVGEVLSEAGFTLSTADSLTPPAGTPIRLGMDIFYQPAVDLHITLGNSQVHARSAAPTIGQALSTAGLPLTGLDFSIPSEDESLPSDGMIRIVHVQEDVVLAQATIPYATRSELSADLEIDQQELIQAGEAGLAISRQRIRSEDGVEVGRDVEQESVIRLPQDQVQGIGTQIVIRTAIVDGISIEYWRALTLFATYYVPCIPGTTICHYGTASGTRVHKGSVAFVYPWYLLFAGERLYIPGYGFGVVEDTNGAWTAGSYGSYWIDLGYAETDVIDWDSQYVTVYFLTPVPANVADTYLLP